MKYSVCLASFNGEFYIKDQLISIIESFVEAEIHDFEIVVSDDRSIDNTIEIVEGIGDHRIRVLTGPSKGLIKNFEYLLSQARGEVIFLADQDDVWSRKKVSVCISELETADMVVSDAVVVDSNLNALHPSFFELRNSGPGLIKNILVNSYLGCCMCFKKEVLSRLDCHPFPKNIPMHDWWLGLVFDRCAKVSFIRDKLVFYRRHGKNASPSGEESKFSRVQQIKWRGYLIFELIKRAIR